MSDVQNRTVNQLVIDAFKLIAMYTEDRTPPSYRIMEGIEELNTIIDEFESASVFIPYCRTLIFTCTVGKGSYTIGDDAVNDVVYNKPVQIFYAQNIYNNAVVPMNIIPEAVYYNAWTVSNCMARPIYCWLEKDNLFATLKMYPLPSLPYTIILRGKFGADNLYNGDLLSDKITPSYYAFLKHALARRLKSYYPTSSWDDMKEAMYQEMLGRFTAASESDSSFTPIGVYPSIGFPSFNWKNS